VAKHSPHKYAAGVSIDPAALPDDVDALKRIIDAMAGDAVAARIEIEKLRFHLARLKRAQFGRSSEKIGAIRVSS
jgi:hypothetical protein